MDDETFPLVVSLACHDLRTPLATIFGFARTLNRMEEQDERTARFLGMIEDASDQMTGLLDGLGTIARIQADRWEPALREVDIAELVATEDARVRVEGSGEAIETEADAVGKALQSLALAALRHGPVDSVTWTVHGRELELRPVTDAAAPVLTGGEVRDLGSLVARAVIERLGGSLVCVGDALHVSL
ncbi:MAG TPA: histidine kinase dimerization/phospho-acceptor domain-containing protein [Gaiellaceae bacterium]|nr:histidine kinase dimerization/phospho-acceptor domain-containing protein [Gaiellaceae bacterium]